MKKYVSILSFCVFITILLEVPSTFAQNKPPKLQFKFYGDTYYMADSMNELLNQFAVDTLLIDKSIFKLQMLNATVEPIHFLYLMYYFNIAVSNDDRKQLSSFFPQDSNCVYLEHYLYIINPESKIDYDSYYFETSPQLYDFNHDQIVDLILIPDVYYGPSRGFAAYGYNNNQYIFLFHNSGGFADFEYKQNLAILRFSVTQIELSEPYIIYSVLIDPQQQTCELVSVNYYATQTLIPILIGTSYCFEANSPLIMRHSNNIIDKLILIDSLDDSYSYDTAVLYGNVIALFSDKAQGVVLAQQDEWLFVAAKIDATMLKTSLLHGMDYYNYNIQCKEILSLHQRYICGWIHQSQIDSE